MAGSLLHITLAHEALGTTHIPRKTRAEIKSCIDDFRLGALIVDLPFYEKLWVNGLRILLGLSINHGVWGFLIHSRSPRTLAMSMLDQAKDPSGRALALGLLTHMAVDIVFHKEIHQQVMSKADGTISIGGVHRQIEDQMDLHVHYNILGHSGLGTPYARRMLRLRPDPSWTSRFEKAIAEVHGTAPDEGHLKTWLNSLALYGLSSASSKVPWVTAIPKDDPELREISLDLAQRAIALSCKYIETGLAYLDGTLDPAGFKNIIPDLSMQDGTPAEPIRK